MEGEEWSPPSMKSVVRYGLVLLQLSPLQAVLACVAGGIVGAHEIKFWKRMAKPREIPPARELGCFEYRPLLSPH